MATLLGDEKANQIAQSDKWTALSRLSSILAAGVTTLLLTPLVIWGFATLQTSSVVLAEHSGDIARAQATLDQIQKQTATDHDTLVILGTRFDSLLTSNAVQKAARDKQVDGIMEAIAKLWQRRDMAPKDPTP